MARRDLGVDGLRVQNLSRTFDDTDPAGAYDGIRQFTARQALWTGTGIVQPC
ncbi:hypothetical protein [Paractinoplanes rishiriensis]|uniref:Uncharacterized protein n=1 Tax=Paractinoplanes rishiriensis TaxID=1050105 RepID=A0A919K116_9ACTN|nr:hypothetical protein [Actinoplanes rishiriensis]GIE97439.1 hypothetical protein Ari01nite_49040 [Actinoplanes rishiriensis]